MDMRSPTQLTVPLSAAVSRRAALRQLGLVGTAAAVSSVIASPLAVAAQDQPIPKELPPHWFASGSTFAGHGQVIMGEGPIYLSHLPMFMFDHRDNNDQLTGRHPHHYQVIVEVEFSGPGAEDYLADRESLDPPFLYTLDPEPFHMLDLIAPVPENERLTSFTGSIVRGHFERKGKQQPFGIERQELPNAVQVDVTRVIYAHEFSFHPARPPKLEYVLFGKGEDLFLAHHITMPPDFDQLLPVMIADQTFTDAALQRGIILTIPERANTIAERLMAGETATAEARDAATGILLAAGFRVGAEQEFFLEEGELRFPDQFAPSTQAEIDAGFGFPPIQG
jgi:hypothetical protein